MTLLASGTFSRSCARVLSLAFGALFCPSVWAQSESVFSVDWQGQTTGVLDQTSGVSITDGDILIQEFGPFPNGSTPMPPPQIRLPAFYLASYLNCAGHTPGVSCGLEMDALSFGRDARLLPSPGYGFRVYFSVDEFAQGVQLSGTFPNLRTEAQAQEAASDIFVSFFQGVGPIAPGIVPNNLLVLDGNGRDVTGNGFRPGLGLIEPSPPSTTVPDPGSNLDAFENGLPFAAATTRVYFSLQGGVSDPNEIGVAITNSAAAQGANGGDVLVFNPASGAVAVYASADQLGLDLLGIGVDDLDALVVVENGIPGYQPPLAMYDWATGASDLILFSVRRGSAVIGSPDSLLGLPILPGDVLIPPILPGAVTPGVFVAAEALGLETNRSAGQSDELDSLDLKDDSEDPIIDCNHNGIEDSKDIADGTSPDNDGSGIPDECEDPGYGFCECTNAATAPCGNSSSAGLGCLNGAGLGGKLEGTGTSSVATDSLVLTASQLPVNNFGLVFVGDGIVPPTAVGNGLRCVGGSVLYRLHVGFSGPTGTFNYGPGIVADANTFPNYMTIFAGDTWFFQAWYRDHGGPCGADNNMTNAWAVTFTP
ncbi:MAG: hypothetical protein R3F17_13365 [Planctomycetota bacterium]